LGTGLTKFSKYLFTAITLVFIGAALMTTEASFRVFKKTPSQYEDDEEPVDDTNFKAEGPQFKLKKDPDHVNSEIGEPEGIQLKNPSNFKSKVEYDPETNQYVVKNKVGNLDYRQPYYMEPSEYRKYEMQKTVRDYWKQQANGGKGTGRNLGSSFNVGGEVFQKVFGGSTISIVPQGEAELIFKGNVNTTNNPIIPETQRSVWSFDFEEKIQMNVTGTIGDRVKLGVSYNTDASFEFENKTKIEYEGDEDDIVRKIEAGNVTLPLPGTLITGSQSLFGIKTELQFGKLNVTTVLSQQKGQTQVVEVQGGAQVTPFEITSTEYEANKHFFLGHSFRGNFDKAHKSLPQITSPITITKIEVWVTNKTRGKVEDVRPVYAFTDLGETNPSVLSNAASLQIAPNNTGWPSNGANTLYNIVKTPVSNRDDESLRTLGLVDGRDYDKTQSARKLTSSEYSVDTKLGYISLNMSLNNDEILGVAYEYMVNGYTYKVGDLSTEVTSSKTPLVLKLLKGTTLSPKLSTWDLMMKNIYNLNAYEISKDDFYLNVLYHDNKNGSDVSYIPEPAGRIDSIALLKFLGLDNTNSQMNGNSDGVFDFIDGVTIDKRYGRVIFPMLEPFGRGLRDRFIKRGVTDSLTWSKYTYYELYDSTKTKAEDVSEKNKFKLKGTYKSASSSEIYLNAMNIPKGSVKVTSGGMPLVENQDYVVDYALGTVKITNSAIMSSGQPIKVSLENNANFNFQTKTMIGTHLNYKVNDNFDIGGTLLHLSETPLTSKVNIGDEPISNTIWGLNASYRANSQFLTTMVDKLPLLQTKEMSSITVNAEFAQLIPGTSSKIGKKGVAYIDDFEASETKYDLKYITGWTLSSTPQTRVEGNYFNNLDYNRDRARLSFYTIDESFYRKSSLTPAGLTDSMLNANDSREILETELFPKKQNVNGVPTNMYILNLTFNPNKRGPYNFNTTDLDQNGNFITNPEARWGGMMRALQTNDFEAANIGYIQFWVMDPFYNDSTNNNQGGDMYFQLGDISEDILKDGKMSFEQGLPTPGDDSSKVVETVWGKVPDSDPITKAFVTGNNIRKYQDVGLDGLSNEDEAKISPAFAAKFQGTPIMDDPSGDDFKYFRNADFNNKDIVSRYEFYNGMENNSPEAGKDFSQSNYSTPDMEDINDDNTLSDKENFFEYRVSMRPNDLVKGTNYVVDATTYSKGNIKARWVQFKIPIEDFTRKFGTIEDFKSIRFLRIYLTGFNQKTTFRFATLDLVRSEWRKYNGSLLQNSEGFGGQAPVSNFDLQSINIEENGDVYDIPSEDARPVDPTNSQYTLQNEQSMVLKVENLADDDARAVFKNGHVDMRQYKRLKMYTHAQPLNGEALQNGDVTVFVRFGTDNKENYYEYEVPMIVSPIGTNISRDAMWPAKNQFDIELAKFLRLKQERNDADVSLLKRYVKPDGDNNMYICGNPSLSDIRTIMIGVRNPSEANNKYSNDGAPKSAEIWLDELRLTDFSDQGGWAANARAQIKLADFGNIRIAGATMQPGFGSIEKKVNDRAKETTNQIDASTDLELGKFFPEKAQVRIPFYASYSQIDILPQYNPYDPDIPLQAAIDNAKTQAEKDKLRKEAIDHTLRRSFSFTNVKVNKASKTPRFYDPANFSVSYGYNETKSYNYATKYKNYYHHEGGFNYIFNNRPKNIMPLKKVSFLNKKAFQLIRDINFYYAPTSISFRTNMTHDFHEVQLKNLNDRSYELPKTIDQSFLWNRMYDIRYDLSRAIKVDFSATNAARIEEWDETMDKQYKNDPRYDVWKQIKEGGRNINYKHQINITYTVPVNKLPLLDWTSLSTRYSGTYEWQRQPFMKSEEGAIVEVGHNIANSRSIQINPGLNLNTLYNKVAFLRDLNAGNRRGKGAQKEKEKEMKTVSFEKEGVSLKAGEAKSISHKLGSEDVTIKVTDSKGNEVKGTMEVASPNRLIFTPEKDVTGAKIVVEGKVEAGPDVLMFLARNVVRLATGVKTISVSYTQTEGTALPGYIRPSKYLGMSGDYAPGWQFVMGEQAPSLVERMVHKEWISNNELLSGSLLKNRTQSVNVRVNYEPFRGLRVDLTGNHSFTQNISAAYLYTGNLSDTIQLYLSQFSRPMKSGNMSMTIISLGSWENMTKDNYANSKYFDKFKEAAITAAQKLNENNQEIIARHGNSLDTGTQPGFNRKIQQALIPAFLSTYGGYGLDSKTLALFPVLSMIRPNWRVNYDGLIDIPIVGEYAQSVNLTHAYVATYNVGSYTTNSKYDTRVDYSYVRDRNTGFYVPQFDVGSVSITEQFSPLIGVDVTLKNNITARAEYKKNRSLMLGTSNYSLIESYGKEYVFGAGYRFPDIPLTMLTLGAIASPIKSDLDLRADVSIRQDMNVMRKLDDGVAPSLTQGNTNVKISFTADYQLSDRLTVRLFYDRALTNPYISSSFMTIATDFGFSVRFVIAQ